MKRELNGGFPVVPDGSGQRHPADDYDDPGDRYDRPGSGYEGPSDGYEPARPYYDGPRSRYGDRMTRLPALDSL